MKPRLLICIPLLCSLALVAGEATTAPLSNASDPGIPHLRKQGTATQLIVDGKPFLALAGELLNNSATSIEHMKPIWPKLVESKFNTVLAGVSWAQIEPAEGKFDFTRAGRRHPGSAEPQPASRAALVRKLEERPVQLPARLGEEGLRAVPARPGHSGQEHRTTQLLQRCEPGRRCPRLCRPDAACQGSGWPAAHGHHDPGGERNQRPRPFAPGRPRLARARCRRS